MNKSRAIWILFAGLFLAGCGDESRPAAGGGDVSPPSIPANPPAAPSDLKAVNLPLDPYTISSPGDVVSLAKASRGLTIKCMKDRGFEYKPDGEPAAESPDKPRMAAYGVNDAGLAASKGYSVSSGLVSIEDLAAAGKKLPTTDEQIQKYGRAWYDALHGPNPNCTEANKAMYDNAYGNVDRELPHRLMADALNLTKGDKRVMDVLKQWSSCMAERGHKYGTPMDPLSVKWPKGPTIEEKNTAVADVECKQRTNLPGIWLAVEKGYQQALVDKNAEALKAYQVAWRRLITEAEKVGTAG